MTSQRLNIEPKFTLLIFIAAFVSLQTVLCFNDEVLPQDIPPILILTTVFILLTWSTSRGNISARWVLSVLLILYSIMITFAGISIPSIPIVFLGVVSLFFGLILHLPAIKILTKQNQIDLTRFALPDLTDRFKSAFIDSTLILTLLVLIISLFPHFDIKPLWIRVTCISVVLIYEPLLVSYSCTVGQAFTKIRVRSINSPKGRINVLNSYSRFLTKVLLGLISFIVISFNKNKRAIHDYAGASIVVKI